MVSDVHALDPERGTAILKVGEKGEPREGWFVTVVECHYSWREWDLINNREIRRVKDCVNPFDPVDG